MQIVSIADNLHAMSKLVFWEKQKQKKTKKKLYLKCRLLKFLPRLLSINEHNRELFDGIKISADLPQDPYLDPMIL